MTASLNDIAARAGVSVKTVSGALHGGSARMSEETRQRIKGIAEELFITETTVRHHLTSVFNKLEISSRLELVIYAFKNNLVTMPNGNGSLNGNGHTVPQGALVG